MKLICSDTTTDSYILLNSISGHTIGVSITLDLEFVFFVYVVNVVLYNDIMLQLIQCIFIINSPYKRLDYAFSELSDI